ncbi:hypothetical protein ACIRPQ_28865 [Streptomyces sp. NPDC101213]|uniref:hypothetical protein n=1 Tax=Streptomyces sp. NPDC101213 TaxID=3366130 RepID=UPI00380FF0E0
MRIDRFQPFVRRLIETQSGVTAVQDQEQAEDWPDRPHGLVVTFSNGAQVWFAITQTLAPGDKHEQAEVPVEAKPPVATDVPAVPTPGQMVTMAENWLAAVISTAENPEVEAIKAYGDSMMTASGVSVRFHNGAKIQMAIEYVAAPGRRRNHKRYELQEA